MDIDNLCYTKLTQIFQKLGLHALKGTSAVKASWSYLL